MTRARIYKSKAMAAVHETVSGMFEAGVFDKKAMRRFDESCLTPVHEFTAKEIRELREREEVGQTVFARHLNVTKEAVSQWARGERPGRNAASGKDPAAWP